MATVVAPNYQMKWNLENFEVRTKSVEKTLEPLVTQVTTLVNTNTNTPSNKRKGKSKKADVLVAAVEKAIENFLNKGGQIVRENPEAAAELSVALNEVNQTGDCADTLDAGSHGHAGNASK